MKDDHDKLDDYVKSHKRLLESMTDEEYNEHLNELVKNFHTNHPLKNE